jgi:hypothetical protein
LPKSSAHRRSNRSAGLRHSVVEFAVVFDESERPESVHEEPASADHFRETASPPSSRCLYEKPAELERGGEHNVATNQPDAIGSTR